MALRRQGAVVGLVTLVFVVSALTFSWVALEDTPQRYHENEVLKTPEELRRALRRAGWALGADLEASLTLWDRAGESTRWQPEGSATNVEANLRWAPTVPGLPLTDERLPAVVRAWRQGQVDWHDLMPEIPDTGHAGYNFAQLVLAEERLTGFLSRPATHWGRDYGPLEAYRGCLVLRDPCNIHDQSDCMTNSFCAWCPSNGLCVSALPVDHPLPSSQKPVCPGPLQRPEVPSDVRQQCRTAKRITGNHTLEVVANLSTCNQVIYERSWLTSIPAEAQAMFFHWYNDYFESKVYQNLAATGDLEDLSTHIILQSPGGAKFYQFWGLVSKFCWRDIRTIPPGTCLCDVPPKNPRSPPQSSHEFIVGRLGLADIPVPRRPRVGLISRQHKRFVLNEFELAGYMRSIGLDFALLPFELMTLYEQVRELRSTTLLIGIHGSGLVNAVFLHPSTVMLQILPYGVQGGSQFFKRFTDRASVIYEEWVNPMMNHTVMHEHFLPATQRASPAREAFIARGANAAGSGLFFTFWINQDTIVPLPPFKSMLVRCLQKGVHKSTVNRSFLARLGE